VTRRAFTLTEVLVATAITAILAASLFAFLNDLRDRQADLLRSLEQTRAATELLDAIERAAGTSVATGSDNQPGFQGRSTSLTIAHRPDPLTTTPTQSLAIQSSHGSVSLTTHNSPEPATTIVIHRLTFAYHNGERWSSSSNRQLPRAIRVKLWFDPPPSNNTTTNPDSESDVANPIDTEPLFEEEDTQPDTVPPDRVRIIAIPGASP